MVFHLHGCLFGKIHALKWSIRAKWITNSRSGIEFSTFRQKTMWQWQLWVLLTIKKWFQGCLLLTNGRWVVWAVCYCLNVPWTFPPPSHVWYFSCGSGDSGRGGRWWWTWQAQHTHLYWPVPNHNTVMQSNTLIPASNKKRKVQWHLINFYFTFLYLLHVYVRGDEIYGN